MRPPSCSPATVAATMPAEVSELSTMPTLPAQAAPPDTNRVSRELTTSCTPTPRRKLRLVPVPAVARTLAPAAVATCVAASPTPPVPPCTRTLSPACTAEARWRASSTVTNTVGAVAACSKERLDGIGTAMSWKAATYVPRLPPARPSTACPTCSAGMCAARAPTAATTPEQSPPGIPGSPGYMPSTLSTSLKLSPMHITRSSTWPGGHAGAPSST